jgi:hypothetical protein
LAVLALLLCSITSSWAQFSVNIGINVPVYPQLVRVPGYPVYYAPQLSSNYFFYDGMYWVLVDDNWYASTWYNGPWELVAPDFVPVFLLRVPVRYYRRPPVYFHGWRSDAPPRWGDHWGNTWYSNHRDWDRWNRSAAPAPAPLPVYQRQYSGNRYPRAEQQMTLQTHNYHYQPRDATVQRQYQAQRAQIPATAAPDRQRTTSSSATQQQAARPPSSPQSRPSQTTPRDAQQAARPPSTQQARTPQSEQRDAQPAARPPSTQQARPPQSEQQAARPPSSPQGRPPTSAQGRPPGIEQRDAQQAARTPSAPQGHPPGAEQRAAAPPQSANTAVQSPRPPQAAPPRGEPAPHAQGGEPPARDQGGEPHGNGRGPQDNKPD